MQSDTRRQAQQQTPRRHGVTRSLHDVRLTAPRHHYCGRMRDTVVSRAHRFRHRTVHKVSTSQVYARDEGSTLFLHHGRWRSSGGRGSISYVARSSYPGHRYFGKLVEEIYLVLSDVQARRRSFQSATDYLRRYRYAQDIRNASSRNGRNTCRPRQSSSFRRVRRLLTVYTARTLLQLRFHACSEINEIILSIESRRPADCRDLRRVDPDQRRTRSGRIIGARSHPSNRVSRNPIIRKWAQKRTRRHMM